MSSEQPAGQNNQQKVNELVEKLVNLNSSIDLETIATDIDNLAFLIHSTYITASRVDSLQYAAGLSDLEISQIISAHPPFSQRNDLIFDEANLILLGNNLMSVYQNLINIGLNDIATKLKALILQYAGSAFSLLYNDSYASLLLLIRGIDPFSVKNGEEQPTDLAKEAYEEMLDETKSNNVLDEDLESIAQITNGGIPALASMFLSQYSGTPNVRLHLRRFLEIFANKIDSSEIDLFSQYLDWHFKAVKFYKAMGLDLDFISLKDKAEIPITEASTYLSGIESSPELQEVLKLLNLPQSERNYMTILDKFNK